MCDLYNECPAYLGFNAGVSCCIAALVCNGTPSWIGDGYCDDDNNNEGCYWDGDNCCNGGFHNFCAICECLDPNY